MLLVKPGIVLSITMAITKSNVAISNSVPHFNTVVTYETLWGALSRYQCGGKAGTVTNFYIFFVQFASPMGGDFFAKSLGNIDFPKKPHC